MSDVHPEGGTDEIRARARRPSAMRWLPITVAAAAATAVVIGGGAWLAQRQPGQQPAGWPARHHRHARPRRRRPAGHPVDATVYYVGDTAAGPRLFPETRQVADATDSDLQVAVDEALTGTPKDPDYQNAFKALGLTATATADSGAVTIDLSDAAPRPSGMDAKTAEAAVQSLVRTADAAAKSDPAGDASRSRAQPAGERARRRRPTPPSPPAERRLRASPPCSIDVPGPGRDRADHVHRHGTCRHLRGQRGLGAQAG